MQPLWATGILKDIKGNPVTSKTQNKKCSINTEVKPGDRWEIGSTKTGKKRKKMWEGNFYKGALNPAARTKAITFISHPRG